MSEIETVKELVTFLDDPKPEVRKLAAEAVAPLSERADVRTVLLSSEVCVRGLLRCLTSAGSRAHALASLVNLSHEDTAQKLFVALRAVNTVVDIIVDGAMTGDDGGARKGGSNNPRSRLLAGEEAVVSSADTPPEAMLCMLLSNLTRWEDAAAQVVKSLPQGGSEKDEEVSKIGSSSSLDGVRLLQLAQVFALRDGDDRYDHLASVFCNVSATECGRAAMIGGGTHVLSVLLPLVARGTVLRRRGIVGCVRNCTFDENSHEWALPADTDADTDDKDASDKKNGGDEKGAEKELWSKSLAILPHILPSLVGSEPFSDEEAAKAPVYVMAANKPDAKREADEETRTALVDILALLCRRRRGREVMRNGFVYEIIRELHKWETAKIDEEKMDSPDFEPPAIMESIQKVVDSLCADEASYDPIEDGPEEISSEPYHPEEDID